MDDYKLGMVFREESKHQVHCDFCKRVTHQVYRVSIGDFMYKFCSGMHAQAAINNYHIKKKNGMSPNLPGGVEEDADILDENSDYE